MPLRGWIDMPFPTGTFRMQPEPAKDIRLSSELIDWMPTQYSIDPNQLFVVGHSSGGGGTWDMGLRYPGRFATAIPLAGGTANNSRTARLVHLNARVPVAEEEAVLPPLLGWVQTKTKR